MIDLDQKIINFLDNFFKAKYDIAKASEDASFRKYYRAFFKAKTYIIMIAPPDKEPIDQFIFLAKSLKEKNINAPQLFEFNPNLGIVIMQDLGMTSLLDFINDSNYQEDQMFDRLIQLIYQMQLNCSDFIINSYDHKKLKDELDLFHTWYLKNINFDQAKLLEIYSYLIERAGSQVQKFVHRDFHSRNLLINDHEIGVIDFQDALIGPVTYDLVSILKDAYHKKNAQFIIDKCIRYWQLARDSFGLTHDFSEFFIDFELMGVQRHLKILGIFKRLSERDGKHQYLNDIPLIEEYLLDIIPNYPKLKYVGQLILEKRKQDGL